MRDVLRRGRAARAHIVNLGHGVPPDTDPDTLTRIVELVHAESVVSGEAPSRSWPPTPARRASS